MDQSLADSTVIFNGDISSVPRLAVPDLGPTDGLIAVRTCSTCGENAVYSIADECGPCRDSNTRDHRGTSSKRRILVSPLTEDEAAAAVRAIQSYIPENKRSDIEREWKYASAWAENVGVEFPWTPSNAQHFALHILREYGIDTAVIARPDGTKHLAAVPAKIRFTSPNGDKIHESTFNGRMRAVDLKHSAEGYAPPWQEARVQFNTWWHKFRKLYLTRQPVNAKDALLLPELLVMLDHLSRPTMKQRRDAALVALAADPRLLIDTPIARRPGWSFFASVSTSDVQLFADGSVSVRGKYYRGYATLHIPPGVGADAVRVLVLSQQPQKMIDGKLQFASLGVPVRDLDAWDGPLLPSMKYDVGPGTPMTPSGVRRAIQEALSDHLVLLHRPDVVGSRFEISLDQRHLESVIHSLSMPSLEALRDGAWMANAWWLGARGMEILGRSWSQVEISPNGVIWELPRKADSSGRRVKYAVPHISLPFADPGNWLRLLKARLEVQHHLYGGRPLLESDPVFPANLGKPSQMPGDATEFSKRVQRIAAALGIPGNFASHSFRIGCANSLRLLGVEEEKIMLQLDWSDPKQYRAYFRHVDPYGSSSGVLEGAVAAGLASRMPVAENDHSARLRRIVSEAKASGRVCRCESCSEEVTLADILGVQQSDQVPREISE